MEITKQTDNSKCALTLAGDMTIYTATENKVHFEPYFDIEQSISLDMLAVNEFDSTGFQMLLLLERQATENKKAFSVNQASPAVKEVLTLYNKQDWLN
ncbi:MAG: STAS domain-containing protein [Methylococcaceae bacterium]